MCSSQGTVGGDKVVENYHCKSDLTTSDHKTGVVSATCVLTIITGPSQVPWLLDKVGIKTTVKYGCNACKVVR